jgi:hypothetical protein
MLQAAAMVPGTVPSYKCRPEAEHKQTLNVQLGRFCLREPALQVQTTQLACRQRSAEAAQAAAVRRADALEQVVTKARQVLLAGKLDTSPWATACEAVAAQCCAVSAEAERQHTAAQAGPCFTCLVL